MQETSNFAQKLLHEIVEVSWAAGFYDGEGSTGFGSGTNVKGRKYRRLHVQISQHFSPEALERFKAAVGGLGSIYGPYGGHMDGRTGKERSLYWKYMASHKQGREVLEIISPYLSGPKREQADAALAAWEDSRVYPGRRARAEPIAA